MRRWFAGLLVSLLLGVWFEGHAAANTNLVLAPYGRDLVVLHGKHLVPFKATRFLQAPRVVLYFGAGWCPDCRKFSPKLVAAYDRQPATRRQFEVLLISQDRSADEMRGFMVKENMRWPALAYDKVAAATNLNSYHPNNSIPWLSVIDRNGKVLLHSESDKDAAEVLQKLEAMGEK